MRTPHHLAGRPLPVELILMRQLADLVPTAMFLADSEGQLLYYNETGASLAGMLFEETRHCRIDACVSTYLPTDASGRRIPDDGIPLLAALRTGRPVHQQLSVRTRDGRSRTLGVTALPITESGGNRLGAVAICWDIDPL